MDLTDRDEWRAAFTAADVLVMTGGSSCSADELIGCASAQIFTNILTHSHCSIDKVYLLYLFTTLSANEGL